MYTRMYPLLTRTYDSKSLKFPGLDLPIIGVSASKVYYLHDSRNAWNYTKNESYNFSFGDNFCFNSFEGARKHAETLRKQGTVFFILEEPALHFIGSHNSLIAIILNDNSPFKHFRKVKFLTKLVDVLKTETTTEGGNLSFRQLYDLLVPPADCWTRRYLYDQNFTIKYSTEMPATLSDVSSALKQYKSYSVGRNYFLKYEQSDRDCDSMYILKLAKFLNELIVF